MWLEYDYDYEKFCISRVRLCGCEGIEESKTLKEAVETYLRIEHPCVIFSHNMKNGTYECDSERKVTEIAKFANWLSLLWQKDIHDSESEVENVNMNVLTLLSRAFLRMCELEQTVSDLQSTLDELTENRIE